MPCKTNGCQMAAVLLCRQSTLRLFAGLCPTPHQRRCLWNPLKGYQPFRIPLLWRFLRYVSFRLAVSFFTANDTTAIAIIEHTIPVSAPEVSIITSLNRQARPGTKYWCSSSVHAYKKQNPRAAAVFTLISFRLPSVHDAQNPRHI